MSEGERRRSRKGSARPRATDWQVRYLKKTRFIEGHNSPTQISRWKSSGHLPDAVGDALDALIHSVKHGTEPTGGKVPFASYIENTWLPHHRPGSDLLPTRATSR